MGDITATEIPRGNNSELEEAPLLATKSKDNDLLQDLIRRNLPEGKKVEEYVKTCSLAELGQITEAMWQVSGGKETAGSELWKIVDKFYDSDLNYQYSDRRLLQRWMQKEPAFSVSRADLRTLNEEEKQSADKEAEERVVEFLKDGYQYIKGSRVSLLLAALDLSQDKSKPRGEENWQNFIGDIFKPEIASLRESLAKIAEAGIKPELPPVWQNLQKIQGQISSYMIEVNKMGGKEKVEEVYKYLDETVKVLHEVYRIDSNWGEVLNLVKWRERNRDWDEVISKGFDMSRLEDGLDVHERYNLMRLFGRDIPEIKIKLTQGAELKDNPAVMYWSLWKELAERELEGVDRRKLVIEEDLERLDRWAGLERIDPLSRIRREITSGMSEAERNYSAVKRVTTGVMTLAEIVSEDKSEAATDKASATAAIEQMENFLRERRADFAECDLGEKLSNLLSEKLNSYNSYKYVYTDELAEKAREKISQALEFFQKKLKDEKGFIE